jgi:radical SAM superfamily enzyme YgiQ (UPF0313 family)
MNITLVCYTYGIPLSDACCYPLGFLYVSSILKSKGHNVKILNYNLYDYDFKEEIKNQDLVMFTGFASFKNQIIRDAAICREAGILTSLGGALGTFCEEEMRQHVDSVCVGEYDKDINIDKIPYPDFDGFGIDKYFEANELKHIGVLTSRGCVFNCTFCSQTCKFRYRKVKSVMEEVDFYIIKYGIELVIFNDNTFNFSKSRFIHLCSEMKTRKIPWSASIRCDKFDNEMAKVAKDSYCKYFLIGIESFKQEKLDAMNKQLRVEDIYKTIDLLEKYKINYHGNLLLGFEDESYADIVSEVNNIKDNKHIFPSLVQPFIGTKNGYKRSITKEETLFLNSSFEEYAVANEKYVYSEFVV